MEKQTVYITRHNLSEIFEKTLKLLKPTWKPSLIVCAILYVPVAAATAFFIQSYLGFCLDLIKTADSLAENPMAILGTFLPFMGFGFVYGLVAGIVSMFAEGVVSRNAFRCASGETPGWKDLILEVLRGKLGSLIAFLFLQGLVIAGVATVFCVVLVLVVLLATVGKLVALAILLGVLLYLGMIFVLIGIQYVFQLGPSILVNEDIGPGRALGKCFSLVKGEFFRVFGISILFGMALSLALSMVTMPLQFASLAPFYGKLLESAMNGSGGDPSEILMEMSEAFKGFGVLYGVLVAVQSVLSGMVQPLFGTLLYIDLRVRKNELPDAASFSDLSGQA